MLRHGAYVHLTPPDCGGVTPPAPVQAFATSVNSRGDVVGRLIDAAGRQCAWKLDKEGAYTAFQYPLATGQGYPAATLERLFEEVPTIRAIKDWTPQVAQHEAQIRALQGRKRPINVLSTNSAWLLSSLVLGCNGLLSGSGSVIADLQARLFRAVKANDLAEARRLNDRIYPTARVFYADPFVDMHNRMKEALVLLGKLPRAVVRPPLVKIEPGEVACIRHA